MMTFTSIARAFSRLLGIFTVLLLLGHAPVQAQDKMNVAQMTETLKSLLRTLYDTDAKLDATVTKAYGAPLPADKAAASRKMLRTVMNHPGMAPYLVKIIEPVYRANMTSQDITNAVMQGMLSLQTAGIARLPAEKQARFLRHIIDMGKSVPSETCRGMYMGQLPEKEALTLERIYVRNMPYDRFVNIINLYQDAQLAELNGYPDARTISADQAALAEKVYNKMAQERLRNNVNREILQRYVQDETSLSASEYCKIMTEVTSGMLDMPEPYRSWQLTRFAEGMQ